MTRRPEVLAVGAIALLLLPPGTLAKSSGPLDVSATAKGRELAAAAAARPSKHGFRVDASDLRVWVLGPGDYLVATSLPKNLKTTTETNAEGQITFGLSYDIDARPDRRQVPRPAPAAVATSPAWTYVSQACFHRVGSLYGWLDSCYRIDSLKYESDPRDFYKLEQYGTVGTSYFGKIYSGFLEGARSSGSAPMAWIDWSPRGSRSGSCTTLPLSVSALGIPFVSSVTACEHYNIHKHPAAGHFKVEWSCGCVYPFGQPYPNTRELDYLQAVSVANGGFAQWSISVGFLAR